LKGSINPIAVSPKGRILRVASRALRAGVMRSRIRCPSSASRQPVGIEQDQDCAIAAMRSRIEDGWCRFLCAPFPDGVLQFGSGEK
jgi:hypothetical protein